jgi:hypothetical protein
VLKYTVARLRSEIAGDLDVADTRGAEARVFDLREQQLVDEPLDLCGDAMLSRRLARHQPTLRTISVRS